MHREIPSPPDRTPSTGAFTRWLSLQAYGLVTRTLFQPATPPLSMRRRFERFSARSREAIRARHPAVVFGDTRSGALAIETVRATPHPPRRLLYLHGGAFVMGSAASYRSRAIRFAYRCDAEVFVPEYRLAPEHPYPAALEDAVSAWRALTESDDPRPALVAGDSAGGGLALSLLVRIRQLGQPAPRGAVLLSPWTNLSGEAVVGQHRDLWLGAEHLRSWARHYLGGADPQDPLVSPAYADLSGLSPLLVLVGEHEALGQETLRLVARAREVGTGARLLVGPRMQHDWPLTLPWLAESRRAWREIAEFVKRSDNAPHRRTRATLAWSST